MPDHHHHVPADPTEVVQTITAAIVRSSSGSIGRAADCLLAGQCAAYLVNALADAGLMVFRQGNGGDDGVRRLL